MELKTSIVLNGQERQLDFEAWWYKKFLGQKLNMDPITNTLKLDTSEKIFDAAVAIIYSGMMTDYKVRKATIDFTYPQVEDWVGCLNSKVVTKFIADYTAMTLSADAQENGEPVGEDQSQAAVH